MEFKGSLRGSEFVGSDNCISESTMKMRTFIHMNTSGDRELRTTKDGSHTVYSGQFDQHYHNPNGAVDESRQVFFEKSDILEKLKNGDDIRVLETGFGTGLNFLLLLDYAKKMGSDSRIVFESVEAFPLSVDESGSLNYEQFLDADIKSTEILTTVFKGLKAAANTYHFEKAELRLWLGSFESWQITSTGVDYFFHDPFSPEANPELWNPQTFEKLKSHASENAILATYCAASKARGAMAKAGWLVARAPGALGKREMTIASLQPAKLEGYKRINEEKLADRFYGDA